jgi:hypothetical protein
MIRVLTLDSCIVFKRILGLNALSLVRFLIYDYDVLVQFKLDLILTILSSYYLKGLVTSKVLQGQRDRQTDGQTERPTDGQIDSQIERQRDSRTDEQKDRQREDKEK